MSSTREGKPLKPKSLTNDKTETKLCQVFESLDCNVKRKIWMFVSGLRAYSEFCWMKDCEKVLKAKKFVNQNLWSY